MLKRVQHDNRGLAFFFCHPEPGPELNSGSNDFGISVLGLENLGFKDPPCGRGNLLSRYAEIPYLIKDGENLLFFNEGGSPLPLDLLIDFDKLHRMFRHPFHLGHLRSHLLNQIRFVNKPGHTSR